MPSVKRYDEPASKEKAHMTKQRRTEMDKNNKNNKNKKNNRNDKINKVEVVFILDRSGSMGGLEADTIGGFNSMLAKQKSEEGEVIWSTVLFDHISEVVHDRLPIEKISDLDEDTYYVRGSTALLDAIGGAIHHIGNVHKYARSEETSELQSRI